MTPTFEDPHLQDIYNESLPYLPQKSRQGRGAAILRALIEAGHDPRWRPSLTREQAAAINVASGGSAQSRGLVYRVIRQVANGWQAQRQAEKRQEESALAPADPDVLSLLELAERELAENNRGLTTIRERQAALWARVEALQAHLEQANFEPRDIMAYPDGTCADMERRAIYEPLSAQVSQEPNGVDESTLNRAMTLAARGQVRKWRALSLQERLSILDHARQALETFV